MPAAESLVHLDNIAKNLKAGKVVLFLGAGCSVGAGAPTTDGLIQAIKSKFPDMDQTKSDLLDVCEDVVYTLPYNRTELDAFVEKQFRALKPGEAHKRLAELDWAAIFTTNYDDLIEQAYREPDIQRVCQVVEGEDFHINLSDRTRVFLFKLMGSIDPSGGNPTMVLTHSDFNHTIRTRSKLYETLFDFVKDGTLVFVGYSARDHWAFDVIDEVDREVGKDRLPYSYILLPSLPNSTKEKYKFETRKMIPVECTFEGFITHMTAKLPVITVTQPVERVGLTIGMTRIELDRLDVKNCEEFCQILDDERTQDKPGDRDDFFRGTNLSWGAFSQGWDFQRNVNRTLKERVVSELTRKEPSDNRLFLLLGIAGTGKSVALRRLAYDVYSGGHAPVFFFDSSKTNIDLRLLDNLILEMNRKMDEMRASEGREARVKPLLVVDDVTSFSISPKQVLNYLTSRGRAFLIVTAARTSEWNSLMPWDKFHVEERDTFHIPEKLAADENESFAEQLLRIGCLLSTTEYYKIIKENEADDSFFATMYSAVYPSRPPLSRIIYDMYEKLPPESQKAFLYVCLFNRFNLPINLELLVRALGVSYQEFYESILNEGTRGVIFETVDAYGTVLFRTHHRIIASKTIESFMLDRREQTNAYLAILGRAHFENEVERGLVEKLMVDFLGAKTNASGLSMDQKQEIFSTVCRRYPTRTLLHHWGKVEEELGHAELAENLYKKALAIKRAPFEFGREESDRNILVSLGSLFSDLGIKSLKRNPSKAGEYFAKAETYFTSAKTIYPPNDHAYHAHAFMYLRRADEAADTGTRMDMLAKALGVIGLAEDNLNPDELAEILELKEKVLIALGDEPAMRANMEELAERYKSPNGYAIYISHLISKARTAAHVDESRRSLEEALRLAERIVKRFPRDEYCLRLRAQVLETLEPDSFEKRFEALSTWYENCSVPSITLLFSLAVVAFKSKRYRESDLYYQKLDSVGIGYKRRHDELDYMKDPLGKPDTFSGQVTELKNEYDGGITCKELKIGHTLYFRPISASKGHLVRGDFVKFNITFTMHNVRAVNVRKI